MSDGYLSSYYVGLILTLLFLLFIYPLSFKSTLSITIIVFAGYLLPILIANNIDQPSILITNCTFFFGVIFFINVSAQMYYNGTKPDGVGDWQSRLQIQFLFPKKK